MLIYYIWFSVGVSTEGNLPYDQNSWFFRITFFVLMITLDYGWFLKVILIILISDNDLDFWICQKEIFRCSYMCFSFRAFLSEPNLVWSVNDLKNQNVCCGNLVCCVEL